jgi:hypothetical protein
MRKIIRALFDKPEDLHANDISNSNELKTLLKTQIPSAIKMAYTQKKHYASLFEINDTSCYVDIHKNNWIQALETCLLWYVEDENYEMCTKIKDLIHTIQSKSNSHNVTLKSNKNAE